MKSVILNVRIPVALKEKLESEANQNNLSLSDYTRNLLSDNSIEKDSHNQMHLPDANEAAYYNSNEFIFLLTWILEKRVSPYDTNPTGVYQVLKIIVLKVMKSDDFPDELKQEFAKVLLDLSRFINEHGKVLNNYFRFGLINYPESFDYYMLINFIYKKPLESIVYL